MNTREIIKILEIDNCAECRYYTNVATSDFCENACHPNYDADKWNADKWYAVINCTDKPIDPDCPLEDKK